MSKKYHGWTELEKDYLRIYGPKSSDNVEPEIWVELTEGLNDRIKEWCRKNPLLVTISRKAKSSKPRKAWTRTLIAVQGYCTTYGFSELYPENGPAATAKNLVKAVSRYTKETESSKYPPELDLQLKIMIEDKPDWSSILKKYKELGGEGEQYTHGRDQSNEGESSKDCQNRPVPRSSAGSSSGSRREGRRPVRATELQDEASKTSRVVAERVDLGRDRQHHETNQPLPLAGGSGNDQQKPAAKTGAQSTRQESRRNREEKRMPQEASVKHGNPRDKYRERVLDEPEDGEIVEIKRTDTGRSNSLDKQARDSRREKDANKRREQERKNIFGRR
ncbi:hypothetical protein BPAE_0046g00490 [Botrytis paeoniae]|uniref:Uncharacterized protein n=1 Tax=Botrytis paeoniae TaxID=278948 RepID=A0A4Z1FR38_9HELO|nr:hypothetical protein BPAE_0046g00490 [Botrytis paeoniae]